MKRPNKKPGIWGPFLKFYTRFPIPWWLFILSMGFSVLQAELTVKLTQYTIMLNTGQLYNSAILGYAALNLLICLTAIAVNMTSEYGCQITTLRARGVVWRKILHLPMGTIEEENPSALISRVTDDAPQASQSIVFFSLFVSSAYTFVRMFIVLYQYNPTLTAWLLLAIPAAILQFWLIGKSQFIASKKIFASINTMTSFFSEHLAAVKHFKAQTMEEGERKAGFDAIEARFKADIFKAFMMAFQVTVNSVYTNLCLVILVLTGRREILAGRMEATGLNAANTHLNNVQQHLASILTEYSQIKGIQGVLQKVTVLMGMPEEEKQAQNPMESREEDIVFDRVSFGYNEETEVLHDLSLTIPAGKKTAIVGANGSGKSTLMKLILRFYAPTSGTIRYGTEDAASIHLDQWRQSFGCVLQSAPLFSGTIRENMTYGLDREVTQQELEQAARIADAYDFIQQFPEGFDKEVGEGGMYLSGGQRQRIAIARAVMIDPGLLIMDEATASLDHQSDKQVWEATERLMRGRTTVVIAHDMKAVKTADHILVLNQGKLEAAGKHDALLLESQTYRSFVQLQAAKEAVA